jgi:hypothetical protein
MRLRLEGVRFVRLVLKVVLQNYGDFVDVILLYEDQEHSYLAARVCKA